MTNEMAIDMAKSKLKCLEMETSGSCSCDDAISREAALEKMADYVASGYADSAEDFEEYSRIICQLPSITQKPIVCDDAISCEAVIEWLKAKDIIKLSSQEETARKELKALPPVTPQQKYGKWILADEQNKEDVENDNYRFICSECQCSDIHAKGAIVPYCWKCGAKMQESEEIGEIHCNHTETEIAKSFIEDVEAVKELLPKAGK